MILLITYCRIWIWSHEEIKLKTFINKFSNLTNLSILFSSSFKSLTTWSIDRRKTWMIWPKNLLLTQIYWLVIDHYYFFSVLLPNNHENSELSSDVTSHRVILQISYSFYLVKWNFEYAKFRTTARFVCCMIVLVDKCYNICNVNNSCTGRQIPI